MPEFRIVTGYGKSFTYNVLKDVTTIGRSTGNDIVLSDHTASRHHAKLRKTPDGYLLLDLYSHNGTYVDGSRITSRILKHNDLVEIGTSVLTFENEVSDIDDSPGARRLSAPCEEEEPQKGKVATDFRVVEEHTPFKLLASIRGQGDVSEGEFLSESEAEERDTGKISILSLQRSNKILYVLYEISRTLLKKTEMDELLHTILDLIFQVIDADFGFIVLIGDGKEDLVIKAVKYKKTPQRVTPDIKVNPAIVKRVIEDEVSLLISRARTDFQEGGAVKAGPDFGDQACMVAPLWRKDEVIGFIQLEAFYSYKAFTEPELDLLTTLSNQVAMVMEQAVLMEKVHREEMMRTRLERFHSPAIVDLIISGDNEDTCAMLSPKEKKVTVLFTDIVNFTPLSERLSPTEVSLLLNRYFQEMNDIIFSYNGTLDKYIGDAIMAIFGAPVEREDDAERAVLAALEMRGAMARMGREALPDRMIDIRLGINTGIVVAGNLGSPRRMDYTVIGDVVNTASRLERIAKPNQILIGEGTYEHVKTKFHIQKVGEKSVKGKKHAVTVYEVLGLL